MLAAFSEYLEKQLRSPVHDRRHLGDLRRAIDETRDLRDLLDAIQVSVKRDTRLGQDIECAQARRFAAFLDSEFLADRAHVAHVALPLGDHAGDVERVADYGSAFDLGDDGLLRPRQRNVELFQPLVDPTCHVIFFRVRRSEYGVTDRILNYCSEMGDRHDGCAHWYAEHKDVASVNESYNFPRRHDGEQQRHRWVNAVVDRFEWR